MYSFFIVTILKLCSVCCLRNIEYISISIRKTEQEIDLIELCKIIGYHHYFRCLCTYLSIKQIIMMY